MLLTPLGDSALVLALGENIDDTVAARVGAAAEALRHAKFAGITDVVPAFASVTVFYDIARIGEYAEFEARVAEIAVEAGSSASRRAEGRRIEIPVCYGGEHGPDLEDVAQRAGTTREAVIEAHSGAEYRVHAIGFVPGFAYLGGLPRKLHTPRRATPRPNVPAGSVGIGGAQSGIYPVATPGGWNIIGRTPLRMFDSARPEPARLHAGDRVRFRAISAEEFIAWKSE
jgi:inhibitor of KinA